MKSFTKFLLMTLSFFMIFSSVIGQMTELQIERSQIEKQQAEKVAALGPVTYATNTV